jgi:hypothetical protein
VLGKLFVGLLEDMSSAGLVELDWFDKPTMEKAKDRMVSIADDGGSIAWCG